MGCFDFTYADTGENTRGNDGYLYITKNLSERLSIPNPLPYQIMDCYGLLYTRPEGMYGVSLDIYAIYGAMLYLEGEITSHKEEYEYYLNFVKALFHEKQLRTKEQERLENILREDGIEYFFYRRKNCKRKRFYAPKRMDRSYMLCEKVFTGKIPLIITKNLIPECSGMEFLDTVMELGFVTDTDPNQGCEKTVNHWLPYCPNTK